MKGLTFTGLSNHNKCGCKGFAEDRVIVIEGALEFRESGVTQRPLCCALEAAGSEILV